MNIFFSSNAASFFERHSHALLAGIIIGAFSISILHSFYYRIPPAVDAQNYDIIAENIISGVGYRLDPDEIPWNADRSMIKSGPGYEYFLAGVYYVFGHYYEPVWILQ